MSPLSPKPVQSERRLAARMPSAYYNLYELLETLQEFAQQGDRISAMLGEIERDREVPSHVAREVKKMLGDLPLFSLEIRLESLAESLPQAAA